MKSATVPLLGSLVADSRNTNFIVEGRLRGFCCNLIKLSERLSWADTCLMAPLFGCAEADVQNWVANLQ